MNTFLVADAESDPGVLSGTDSVSQHHTLPLRDGHGMRHAGLARPVSQCSILRDRAIHSEASSKKLLGGGHRY